MGGGEEDRPDSQIPEKKEKSKVLQLVGTYCDIE